MGMTPIGAGNDLALEIIERSKKGDRPVTIVVMGASLDVAGFQWQTGLRTAQGLNLALLIAAQHQGLIGWIQIQTDDVPEFDLELRISGEFESPAQMRLQIVISPQLLHRRLTQPRFASHGATTPAPQMSRRLHYPAQNCFHLLGFQIAKPSSSRRIDQPHYSLQ